MRLRFQYYTPEEREKILIENSTLFLCEEQNIQDGNFLVFSDEPISNEVIYTNVPEEEFNNLKVENESLNLAVIDLYEIILG